MLKSIGHDVTFCVKECRENTLMNPIKLGDTLELAIWLTGTETRQHIEQWRVDAPVMLTAPWPRFRIELSPLRWTIKRPGEDRVPPVPVSISGPDVRLLVAEADVTALGDIPRDRAFVGDLDKRDLAKLRKITKRALSKSGRVISDEIVDTIIEKLGPDSAARALRASTSLH